MSYYIININVLTYIIFKSYSIQHTKWKYQLTEKYIHEFIKYKLGFVWLPLFSLIPLYHPQIEETYCPPPTPIRTRYHPKVCIAFNKSYLLLQVS